MIEPSFDSPGVRVSVGSKVEPGVCGSCPTTGRRGGKRKGVSICRWIPQEVGGVIAVNPRLYLCLAALDREEMQEAQMAILVESKP